MVRNYTCPLCSFCGAGLVAEGVIALIVPFLFWSPSGVWSMSHISSLPRIRCPSGGWYPDEAGKRVARERDRMGESGGELWERGVS